MKDLNVQDLLQDCKECIDINVLKHCNDCETYKKLCHLDISRFYQSSLKDNQKSKEELEEL